MKKPDLRGMVPETWLCIDCGFNTAPGHLNREQAELAISKNWLTGVMSMKVKWQISSIG